MKLIKYLLTGMIFGIVLTKSEVISWYRIYEMFNFQSFHMFGVIGSAVLCGILVTRTIKALGMKTIEGEAIKIQPKAPLFKSALFGGILFGLGWAMTGACPGPMFVLVGHGSGIFVLVIVSAMSGTFLYGLLRDRLPH